MAGKEKPKFKPDATGRKIWSLKNVDGRANVTIGGDLFAPVVQSSKWGGRCGLAVAASRCSHESGAPSIIQIADNETLQAEIVRHAKGDKNKKKGEHHRWYVGDSFDWDIVWASKNDLPDDVDENGDYVVEFELANPQGLVFHYQPALTQAEIDAGTEQSERVAGSYAAYWNRAGRFFDHKGGEIVNYETGKYGHLYCPVLVSDAGWTQQVTQSLVGATLTITIPKEVQDLGQEHWPLVLDPTFGYDSIGGNNVNTATGVCNVDAASIHTAAAGDIITGFSIYSRIAQTHAVAAYNIVAATPVNRLAANADLISTELIDWFHVTGLSQALVEGVDYGAAASGTNLNPSFYYDTIGGVVSRNCPKPLAAVWPAPGYWNDRNWSVYATYEVTPPPEPEPEGPSSAAKYVLL